MRARPDGSGWQAVAVAMVFSIVFCAAFGGMRTTARAEDPAYRLGPGDVLAINVYGDAGLSGQFPVAPDGAIAYPILGDISVAGMTPAKVGERIGKQLAQHIPGLTVSAAVASYAPVFVVGDVEKPGRYEYRPGMIALELVALGGGIRRSASVAGNWQVQLIAARQEYADLQLQVFAQETTKTRLQAELGNNDYAPRQPGGEQGTSARAVRESIVAGEKKMFDIRAAAWKSQNRALAAQERSYDEEIGNLTASIALHDQEMKLIEEDVVSQRTLNKRGLVAKSKLHDVERSLSATRRDSLELGSFLARAKQKKLAIEQARLSLQQKRRDDAARQIQEIDINLARMKVKQRSLLETMAELAQSSEGAVSEAGIEPRFTVLRVVNGKYSEIPINEQDKLTADDILRVKMPSLASSQQASLQ